MPTPRPRYRCRFCGVTFSAWLAVPGEPNGALLLHHITQSHPAELTPFLDQRHTDDDITPAILQAYEEEPGRERAMEPFEVLVRRWAEQTHEFLARLAADPRCPDTVRQEAKSWAVECEHLSDGGPHAWWPDLEE